MATLPRPVRRRHRLRRHPGVAGCAPTAVAFSGAAAVLVEPRPELLVVAAVALAVRLAAFMLRRVSRALT